jgi:two-component system, OmpR family, sensor histidine kinase KdpD
MFQNRYWAYLVGLGAVVAITVLGEVLQLIPYFNYNNMDMFYLLAVAFSTFYLGFGPAIMVSFLGVLSFDFFFVPPIYHFTVADEAGAINLLVLLALGFAISFLSPRKWRP